MSEEERPALTAEQEQLNLRMQELAAQGVGTLFGAAPETSQSGADRG